jgi:hypothetical protein
MYRGMATPYADKQAEQPAKAIGNAQPAETIMARPLKAES